MGQCVGAMQKSVLVCEEALDICCSLLVCPLVCLMLLEVEGKWKGTLRLLRVSQGAEEA